jgi:hypothetical protein
LKADETACGRQITALECGRANFHWVASSLHLAAGEQPEDLHSCTSYPWFLAEKIGHPVSSWYSELRVYSVRNQVILSLGSYFRPIQQKPPKIFVVFSPSLILYFSAFC